MDAIAIRVFGIEKYLLSLNIKSAIVPKIIPTTNRISPGNPTYFRGCFIAIISNNEPITSEL